MLTVQFTIEYFILTNISDNLQFYRAHAMPIYFVQTNIQEFRGCHKSVYATA